MDRAPHIPEELVEQTARGNLLVFVGEGVNQGILPSSEQLAQGITEAKLRERPSADNRRGSRCGCSEARARRCTTSDTRA